MRNVISIPVSIPYTFKKGFYFVFHILIVILLLQLVSSCKKNDVSLPDQGHSFEGEPRPTGIIAGEAITKKIGIAGGTISTPDHSISIYIPAGALSADTTISIQPLTNTNLAGIGNAYRLLPHGNIFQKEVSITVSYTPFIDSLNLPETLGLSYQDDKGVWQFSGNNVVDTSEKTVTFNSMHFSDWALMRWLILKPVNATLQQGEELTLEALHYIPLEPCNCGDDIFEPIPGAYPVGKPQRLEQQYIGTWKLNGREH
ncbi:MAG: hypothetical protein QM802_04925 [Agriterribacter sp.]